MFPGKTVQQKSPIKMDVFTGSTKTEKGSIKFDVFPGDVFSFSFSKPKKTRR